MNGKNEFQTGILHILTNSIHFFIMANIFFGISVFIPVAWFIILDRSLLDIVPVALMGPALTAISSYMVRYIETDHKKEDGPNFSDYIGFYKQNFKETLKIWVPYCILMFVLYTNVHYYNWANPTIGQIVNIIYIVIMAISTLIVIYMLQISAKFNFRIQDLFRLSCYYIIMRLKISLGIASIVFLALVVTYFLTEFFILLVASPLAYLIVKYIFPIFEEINDYFVKKEANEA